MIFAAYLSDETSGIIKRHMETVISSLRDGDISIRRRALDLLYGMCDKSNAKRIVAELLNYLHNADYDIQEELVPYLPYLFFKVRVLNGYMSGY